MGKIEQATVAGGCFWCIEAAFNSLKGVLKAESGYAGGEVGNPTYQQVCSGNTGHAEVVRVEFDSGVISYRQVLEVFFTLHDPTQLNRQGNDVGTQYRSAIFYHSQAQKHLATAIIAEMNRDNLWPEPIVTEVAPLTNYYVAEQHHQDYVTNNPRNPYCTVVVAPKLAKFKKTFAANLK